MTNKNNISSSDLKLSSQRALLGHIPQNLRSVSIDYKDNIILFRCIFDGKPTDDEREVLSMAATEIIADYPNRKIEEDYLEISSPEKMPYLKNLVYLRYEGRYS